MALEPDISTWSEMLSDGFEARYSSACVACKLDWHQCMVTSLVGEVAKANCERLTPQLAGMLQFFETNEGWSVSGDDRPKATAPRLPRDLSNGTRRICRSLAKRMRGLYGPTGRFYDCYKQSHFFVGTPAAAAAPAAQAAAPALSTALAVVATVASPAAPSMICRDYHEYELHTGHFYVMSGRSRWDCQHAVPGPHAGTQTYGIVLRYGEPNEHGPFANTNWVPGTTLDELLRRNGLSFYEHGIEANIIRRLQSLCKHYFCEDDSLTPIAPRTRSSSRSVSQLRAALSGIDEIYLTTTEFREAAADNNVQEVLRKWRYNSPGHQIQKGDGGAIERDDDVHRVLRELDEAVRAQAGDVLAGRVLFLVQLVRQGCGERGFHTDPVCNSGDVICGVTVGHVSRKIAFRMSAHVFATMGEGANGGGFGASSESSDDESSAKSSAESSARSSVSGESTGATTRSSIVASEGGAPGGSSSCFKCGRSMGGGHTLMVANEYDGEKRCEPLTGQGARGIRRKRLCHRDYLQAQRKIKSSRQRGEAAALAIAASPATTPAVACQRIEAQAVALRPTKRRANEERSKRGMQENISKLTQDLAKAATAKAIAKESLKKLKAREWAKCQRLEKEITMAKKSGEKLKAQLAKRTQEATQGANGASRRRQMAKRKHDNLERERGNVKRSRTLRYHNATFRAAHQKWKREKKALKRCNEQLVEGLMNQARQTKAELGLVNMRNKRKLAQLSKHAHKLEATKQNALAKLEKVRTNTSAKQRRLEKGYEEGSKRQVAWQVAVQTKHVKELKQKDVVVKQLKKCKAQLEKGLAQRQALLDENEATMEKGLMPKVKAQVLEREGERIKRMQKKVQRLQVKVADGCKAREKLTKQNVEMAKDVQRTRGKIKGAQKREVLRCVTNTPSDRNERGNTRALNKIVEHLQEENVALRKLNIDEKAALCKRVRKASTDLERRRRKKEGEIRETTLKHHTKEIAAMIPGLATTLGIDNIEKLQLAITGLGIVSHQDTLETPYRPPPTNEHDDHTLVAQGVYSLTMQCMGSSCANQALPTKALPMGPPLCEVMRQYVDFNTNGSVNGTTIDSPPTKMIIETRLCASGTNAPWNQRKRLLANPPTKQRGGRGGYDPIFIGLLLALRQLNIPANKVPQMFKMLEYFLPIQFTRIPSESFLRTMNTTGRMLTHWLIGDEIASQAQRHESTMSTDGTSVRAADGTFHIQNLVAVILKNDGEIRDMYLGSMKCKNKSATEVGEKLVELLSAITGIVNVVKATLREQNFKDQEDIEVHDIADAFGASLTGVDINITLPLVSLGN
jgi:hypothetical protein